LTLVKRLAELHGGSVRVNSAGRGKGSEFIVRLPLVAAESVPPPSKAILALETATSSFSFVVVEDNADLREVTVLSLERAGHEVTSFPDGPSSLAAIAHLQPDALLLDIGLPGLDGFEVLARMKQHPHLKDALFIGISGFQDATNRQERGARFDHYLIKPIDVATLLGLIGGHIQGKKRGALRTLLVEDHSDLAVAMAELLRGEGLEILVAETGQEALEVGPVFRPHLILCDMNLPDMKGLEVIHKLRSSPAVRGTRVAMISARREAELRIYSRKARELGVDDFISKPITRELIRTLVEKLRLSGTGC
jgi:CheY-like chemotaxis protein